MALNAGEVEVLLKLKDELSAKLKDVRAQLKDVGATSTQSGDTVKKSFSGSAEEVDRLYGRVHVSNKEMQEHLGSANNLTSSLKQFDGVLGSVGVHIGSEIKAIGELGGASGKTARELGLISTAGLAIGAGIGGWKIGRAIAEFFDLDKSVAKAWTSLLGFNDLAAETANVRMDTLAKASAIAGHEVKNMAQAVKIVTEAYAADADQQIDWTKRMADAQREVRGLSDAKIAEIDIAQRLGATTEQLTHKYGISADGLRVLAERQKDAAEAQRVHEKATKEAALAAKAQADALDELKLSGDGWKATLATIDPLLAEQIKKYLDAGVSQGTLATAYKLTASQIKAVASSLKEEEDAMNEMNHSIEESIKLWDAHNLAIVEHGGTALDVAMEKIRQWAESERAALKENDPYWQEHYDMIKQTAEDMKQDLLVDWDAIGSNSKRNLDQTAEKAEATFQYMLAHSDQFSVETIDKFWNTAVEARKAADGWNTAFSGALDQISEKVTKSALSWSEAMDAVNRGEGTLTATIQQGPLTPESRAATQKAWNEGRYYGPVVNGSQNNPHGTGPDFTALGYEKGGPTKEGPAYLHDDEYVVPKGGALVKGGGGGGGNGTMIVQLVMADGRELARATVPWLPGELRRLGVA